jgi:hypothetical protein
MIINETIKKNAMKKDLTFTEIQKTIETWIIDTNFDLQQDWNEEKEKMFIQLQCLLTIKSNLDNIENLGGQIFSSSIKK